MAQQIRFVEESVTPERAKELLLSMANDRPFSKNTALNYTEVMRRGEWKFNGDPIRINAKGKVIDGQHRLTAIVNSGKTQRMLLVSGLDDSVFDTIDVGKRRSPSDLLSIAGFTHATPLAATSRALIIYESGALWAEEAAKNLDYNPTGKQIVAYADENPEVFDCVRTLYNSHTYAIRIAPPSAVGLAYVLSHRQNKAKAEAFLSGFTGSEPTERHDPRWIAREYMARQKNSTTHRLTAQQAQAVMIKAANLYFAGLPASVATLRYQPDKHWFPRFDAGRKDLREAAKRAASHK